MSTTKTLPAANSHFISLPQAVKMTERFRNNKENILATEYKQRDSVPLSETFNRQSIEKLLATPGCAGMRIYYSMDEDLKIHAILVAVNDSNKDLLPSEGTMSAANDIVIVEEGQRCPDLCPPPSPLMP